MCVAINSMCVAINSMFVAINSMLIESNRFYFQLPMGLDIADNTRAVNKRVGSYSGVHRLRRYYIELAIEYLKSQTNSIENLTPKKEKRLQDSFTQDVKTENTTMCKEKEKEKDSDETKGYDSEDEEYNSVELSTARAINILQNWIQFPSTHISLLSQSVNYRNISGDVTEDMIRWKMVGLMHFVNCSDCEGAWTYGQCIDILDFFNVMIDFKNNQGSEKEEWDFTHMKELRDIYKYAVEHKGYVIRC